MDNKNYSYSLPLADVKINDSFWSGEQELVRTNVIPYQWEAINDRIENADKSYCIHNFRAAAKLISEGKVKQRKYSFKTFATWPKDPLHPKEDEFYGFLFQDSDLYKWIEAVSYSLAVNPDKKLEKMADEAIELISQAQLPNGYLDTYYILNGVDKVLTNLKDHHELYCFGHLTESAVAYKEATGKEKLLSVAIRFADFLFEHFTNNQEKPMGYPGHEIAEMALVRLYEVTGNENYVKLAGQFINERGKRPYYFDEEQRNNKDFEMSGDDEIRYEYYQAHKPVRAQREIVGHAVRAMYLMSGMTDIARLNKDEELFGACKALWNSMEKEKMYITGGIGGTHVGEAFSFPYDLPNDTAYAETCASIGLCFFAQRMLRINPCREYADAMERALYNTVLAGMAADGKSFFYVNPLEVYPKACKEDERKSHVKSVRQKWFGCACCPPNLARLIESLGKYIYTQNETTLFTHLYIGSSTVKTFQGKQVMISMESQLPWKDRVTFSINANEAQGTLAFRIPQWSPSTNVELSLNNKIIEVTINNGHVDYDSNEANIWINQGYLYIDACYHQEDKITFTFDMKIRVLQASTKVREDAHKVAVTRGPLVYCLEEKDNGENLHLLSLDMNRLDEGKIINEDIAYIELPGKRQRNDENKELYYEYTHEPEISVTLRFVPYYYWDNRGEGEMMVWVWMNV